MKGCDNPTSETKVNQCKWLDERKFNNCFARDANGVLTDIKNPENDVMNRCLGRILQDSEYKNINLDVDFSYLRDTTGTTETQAKRKQKLQELYSKLDTIQKTNQRQREISDTMAADLEVKKRFTYSALYKMIILACFTILFIATIMINNDTLYDFTFIVIMIILIYNLYIFMKP